MNIEQQCAERACFDLKQKYGKLIDITERGDEIIDDSELWENIAGDDFYKPLYQEEYNVLYNYYFEHYNNKLF